MVLHKATAAAGHVVRPALTHVANKSIWKVAPPPKVKKTAGKKEEARLF